MSQYRDNKVSESEVVELRQELEDAPVERKIGRWGAYRDYAQLYREQNQGYHLHYLSVAGAAICTCGLEISGDELLPLHYPNEDLSLQPMQMVAGHRNLPSCEGETVALIVRFRFDWELNDYLWTAYCQVCGKSVVELPNAAAKEFVAEHNRSCQR
jgi:hypothetical protein